MLAALAASLVGLVVDPRVITGAPAWLKPAKFAVSIAIYSFTLAWVFTYLPEWTSTRRIVGWTTAITLIVEVAIIDLQAWRGTTSHFNIGTTDGRRAVDRDGRHHRRADRRRASRSPWRSGARRFAIARSDGRSGSG